MSPIDAAVHAITNVTSTPASPPSTATAPEPAPPPADGDLFTIVLQPAARRFPCAADQTLLQAALAAGIELRSACRNGTCRACLAQLPQGQVRYAIDWPGLSVDERDAGCVLPCVAIPISDAVLFQPHVDRLDTEPPPAPL